MKNQNNLGSKSCHEKVEPNESHQEAKTRLAFDKLLQDQQLPRAVQDYKHAAYINVLVARMEGLQHTDCMQRQTLSRQATQALQLYITSDRNLEDLDTQD
jgi:hypothetical protein